jgi:DNA ligase (NAD+)
MVGADVFSPNQLFAGGYMKHLPAEKVRELTAKLNLWRHEYYNLNVPTVSDAVYDRYFDELARLEKETGYQMSNSPIQTVGYKIVDGLEKTTHTKPLLSLEKTKQISDLTRFIGSRQVLIMHKLDGLTVKLEYKNGLLVRASTRGNGDEGEVITHNTRAIEGIPQTIQHKSRLVVVGEAYIPKATFERLHHSLRDSSGNPYKNARNMAAGSIRCYDASACAGRGVVFSPFSVIEGLDEYSSKSQKLNALKEFGFSPCEFILSLGREISDNISELRLSADVAGIPIDGIVVTYNDIAYSQSCGRTGHHYKDGLAFKFEDELYETVLRSVEWNPSRSGELSPVALFDTVEIDGCEVSRASLHNLAFIRDLELMPGCRILVSKRNMIIPHVEENLDRSRFDATKLLPAKCPSCGEPTRILDDTLYCDSFDCSTQRVRKYVHFVGKKAMNIEGLSDATLEKFIERGWLNKFTDIYRLDEHAQEIQQLDGFGEKSWRRLWDAIQSSRITTFERFVVAMDIPMIGRTASRELSRYFNGDLKALETAIASGFDFTQLNDFGEVLHRNIHTWFKSENNLQLWKELQAMITINKNTITSAAANPFIGRTIVVTGTLEHFSRNTINAKIESLGAKAGSAVSKATDFLICGDKAGSKLDKALTLGVTVLSEQEFLQMAEAA